ncbi:MAG TPA: glycosyltransferase family 2 protein [Aggregatilinea sp.]|uniref:glycosyltransferase family 2 protein n=1 Tax=Aggregatilinea sp. TaxID=2806333 RepID=UPI002CE0BDAC|nr:glycosyltransferase family 2 protein [Aggregatilinea sp.]HML24159.1 glycosyltransferase family 2 protein [Aggregatilinea sp.]
MAEAELHASTPDSPRILALVPAYNEGRHVAGVIAGAKAALPVLVVDDGSSDDTAAEAERAGATVLRQRPNQGKGAALRAGFRWAVDQGYDAIVMLDADGQHDPNEIALFLDRYTHQGDDLVIGSRRFSQMPLLRRTTNTIGRWLFSWAIGQPIPDNQSGYRLVSRRLMEAMLESHESGFEFEVEMIVICIQRGFKLGWVPIRTIYADEVSHIRPGQHVVGFFRLVWHTRAVMRHGNA